MSDVVNVIPDVISDANAIANWVDHNTHVANGSDDPIYVEVLGPDAAKANREVNPGDVVNFATAKGKVTITVYYTNDRQTYAAKRELPSDISGLVCKEDDELQILRVKYGSLWQVDEENP